MFSDFISDLFYRPFTRTFKKGDPHTLPIMGILVAQEDYDALEARLKQELIWKDELAETVRMIHEHLLPFADAGANSQKGLKFNDVTIQMAANVRGLLSASTATMKQQAREIEQLTEQLDNRETIYDLAVAQIREMQAELDTVKRHKNEMYDNLTQKINALQQQQIMLSTTTPTGKRKPRETGAKP